MSAMKLTHVFREGDTIQRIGGGSRNGQRGTVVSVNRINHRVGTLQFEKGDEVAVNLEPQYFAMIRRGRNW